MGTRYNRLTVLMSIHNQCFRAKRRNNVYPGKPQFYYKKVGCKGVFVTRTCFHDARKEVGIYFNNTPVWMQYMAVLRL